MGRTKIKVDLTHDGLIEAQRAIMRYKDELRYKCELFLDRLAEYGIHEAVFAAGGDQDNYGNYLSFRKDISDTADGVQCILVVTSDIIKSEWKYEGDSWKWTFTVPKGATATVTLPGETEFKDYKAGTYTIVRQLP